MTTYEKPMLVRAGTVEQQTQLGMRGDKRGNPGGGGGDTPPDSFS